LLILKPLPRFLSFAKGVFNRLCAR
jgi:hypothetical protein